MHLRDIGMITGPEVAGVGIVRPNITPRGRTVVENYDSSITTYNARTGYKWPSELSDSQPAIAR